MPDECKQVKDPVYGYIEIPRHLFLEVIDTPEFQRLRRIAQTSYAPLYPSALHNRFVHSLGVYHLSRILAETIGRHSLPKGEKKAQERYKRYLEVYTFAALLHDIGQPPFSHNGESCYLSPAFFSEEAGRGEAPGRDARRFQDENETAAHLHRVLSEKLDGAISDEEIKREGYNENPAAAHEIVSAIIGLTNFGGLFRSNAEKEFFARAITGYPFGTAEEDARDKDGVPRSFLNCLVSFLNSKVVDVDRLDYLIRDAYLTGFQTVSLDYRRLLESVRIVKRRNSFVAAYAKNAIGLLENVVYAHDAERKWIQNHPTVIYESYLIRQSIAAVHDTFGHVVCYDNLGGKGRALEKADPGSKGKKLRIRYLCDADMIFLMKNLQDPEVNQVFNRNLWRHVLWKSEAEFNTWFNKSEWADAERDRLREVLRILFDCLRPKTGFPVIPGHITKDLIEQWRGGSERKARSAARPEWKGVGSEIGEEDIRLVRFWLADIFEGLAEDLKSAVDFIVLNRRCFQSSFSKTEFGNIPIKMPNRNRLFPFADVARTLREQTAKSMMDDSNSIFYIFVPRSANENAPAENKIAPAVKNFVNKLRDLCRRKDLD